MIFTIQGSIEQAKKPGAIIAHVVNTKGGFGAGVSGVIGKMFPTVEQRYRAWYSLRDYDMQTLEAMFVAPHMFPTFQLGNNQIVISDDNVTYVNMLAQNGYMNANNKQPLNMEALTQCLIKLFRHAKSVESDVHIPKIGAGLGGGNWDEILEIITNTADAYGVKVYVYSID